MLRVENISIDAGDFNLKNISFSIEKGKTHVIIGPTGSGKTLLLESVIGFKKIKSGKIFINEIDTDNLSIEKRNIAYLPQDLALFPHLDVEANILFSRKVNKGKIYSEEFKNSLIEKCNISHLLKRKIKNLSGGEKQRVALVRALVSESKLLILDEPFSSINQTTKYELLLLIQKIKADYELTILLVTHDLNEAYFIADNISIISNGVFIQTAKKHDLYNHPLTIEVAHFLGIKNIFECIPISQNQNELNVLCEGLNTTIKIKTPENQPHKLYSGSLVLGIRDENIIVLENEFEEAENTVFAELLYIFEKISSFKLIMKIVNTDNEISLEMPAYIFEKSDLFVSKKLKLKLPPDKIFIIILSEP